MGFQGSGSFHLLCKCVLHMSNMMLICTWSVDYLWNIFFPHMFWDNNIKSIHTCMEENCSWYFGGRGTWVNLPPRRNHTAVEHPTQYELAHSQCLVDQGTINPDDCQWFIYDNYWHWSDGTLLFIGSSLCCTLCEDKRPLWGQQHPSTSLHSQSFTIYWQTAMRRFVTQMLPVHPNLIIWHIAFIPPPKSCRDHFWPLLCLQATTRLNLINLKPLVSRK